MTSEKWDKRIRACDVYSLKAAHEENLQTS